MARLLDDDGTGMQLSTIGGSAFKFSSTKIEILGATNYTLVTIVVDETGSVSKFEKELTEAVMSSVKSCKKSPHSENILLRVIKFSDKYSSGVSEIHGFKPLADINPDRDYKKLLHPGGTTPLYDAVYSSVGATLTYGKTLKDNDFGVNGIVFIITDGDDNESVTTLSMIKNQLSEAVTSEALESLVTILIGINVHTSTSGVLKNFQTEAGLTQYIDGGDATPAKLAKLAEFVSQSISSQSQALGTGGPSQGIAATF